jgi:hypothetical protein
MKACLAAVLKSKALRFGWPMSRDPRMQKALDFLSLALGVLGLGQLPNPRVSPQAQLDQLGDFQMVDVHGNTSPTSRI